MFAEVIRAGDVGPISKAAQEWLNHFATNSAKTPAPDTPALRPDLTTPEERKARVEHLLKLRAAAKQAVSDRKAAMTAERSAECVCLAGAKFRHDDEQRKFGKASYILRYYQRFEVGQVLIKLVVVDQLARHTLHMDDRYSGKLEKYWGQHRLGYVLARIIPELEVPNGGANDEVGQIPVEGLDLFEHW
ncbi:hypothetical protein C8R45DRAFT_947749 [Mycena sanguinolenta]|nr:hypothetical protein C8R45DRAFT_947749 [Mycena sanguinolenta]